MIASKFKKFVLITVMLSLIVALGLYFYIFKGHREIANEKVDFTLTVSELQHQFMLNTIGSNGKYLDKVVVIKGKITDIDLINRSIIIDNHLYAVFKDSLKNPLKLNQAVLVKGRFLGYDDLLDEFKIDQASILN